MLLCGGDEHRLLFGEHRQTVLYLQQTNPPVLDRADVSEEVGDGLLQNELAPTLLRGCRSGLAKLQLPYCDRRRVKHKPSVIDTEILKVPELKLGDRVSGTAVPRKGGLPLLEGIAYSSWDLPSMSASRPARAKAVMNAVSGVGR